MSIVENSPHDISKDINDEFVSLLAGQESAVTPHNDSALSSLSKNQMKKDARLSRIEENKLRKRKLEKEKQKERGRLKRQGGALSKRDARNVQLANLRQAMLTGPKICVDLQFEALMSDKELVHLASQLRRVYSSNKASNAPHHLYFVNLNKEGKCYQTCCNKNDGFEDYLVDMKQEDLLNVFEKDSLVYLTPDSENVIMEFDDEKVYVIGGLVDDSVKKDQSSSYAKSVGIKTGRLPIQEFLARGEKGNFKKILTINQVFDIILKWKETGDWNEALCVGVPPKTGFIVNNS